MMESFGEGSLAPVVLGIFPLQPVQNFILLGSCLMNAAKYKSFPAAITLGHVIKCTELTLTKQRLVCGLWRQQATQGF